MKSVVEKEAERFTKKNSERELERNVAKFIKIMRKL